MTKTQPKTLSETYLAPQKKIGAQLMSRESDFWFCFRVDAYSPPVTFFFSADSSPFF